MATFLANFNHFHICCGFVLKMFLIVNKSVIRDQETNLVWLRDKLSVVRGVSPLFVSFLTRNSTGSISNVMEYITGTLLENQRKDLRPGGA